MLQKRPASPATRSPLLTLLAATIAFVGWCRARDITRVLLTVAGLGMLTTAAYLIHVAFGLAATGVALLVLEALRDRDPEAHRR